MNVGPKEKKRKEGDRYWPRNSIFSQRKKKERRR